MSESGVRVGAVLKVERVNPFPRTRWEAFFGPSSDEQRPAFSSSLTRAGAAAKLISWHRRKLNGLPVIDDRGTRIA